MCVLCVSAANCLLSRGESREFWKAEDMRLVFWQSILSLLHSSYIRALAGRPGWDVSVVAQRRMTRERAALGWSVPDFGQARLVIASESPGALALEQYPQHTIHILEGIRAFSMGRRVLPLLRKRSARVGIVLESGDPSGFRGGLRRIVYTWHGITHSTEIDFLLATGSQSVDWYRKCRFPNSKVYPFAYVAEPTAEPISRTNQPGRTGEVTVGFLGALIPRKGGDLLLRAFAAMPDRNWRLIMVGEGESRPVWQRVAAHGRISDRVTFTGMLPNTEAKAVLGHLDLFVLPSRFDGWALVVNEALMQGVPVLCSDRCGARDLLAEPWRGEVFKADCVESLRDVLAKWIDRGKRTPELTQRIKAWSGCIGGESVADYFAAVLQHVYNGAPCPVAPWLRNGSAHD